MMVDKGHGKNRTPAKYFDSFDKHRYYERIDVVARDIPARAKFGVILLVAI